MSVAVETIAPAAHPNEGLKTLTSRAGRLPSTRKPWACRPTMRGVVAKVVWKPQRPEDPSLELRAKRPARRGLDDEPQQDIPRIAVGPPGRRREQRGIGDRARHQLAGRQVESQIPAQVRPKHR